MGDEGFAFVAQASKVPGFADLQTRSNPDHKTKKNVVDQKTYDIFLGWG